MTKIKGYVSITEEQDVKIESLKKEISQLKKRNLIDIFLNLFKIIISFFK